ncbi:hypothetical protein [Nioella sp.]|uniref:hypothetical protein n=1 Tax=Nioella sp. TaxID=1912091 RepID=UPI003B5201BD
MKIIALSLSLAVLTGSQALAAHNNPWATPEDTLLAQNHDENQQASVSTPGEDEMRGVMVQNANRTGGSAGQGDREQGGGGHGGGSNR